VIGEANDKKMAKLIVTIDGPAASGKSTAAQLLAKKLGATFLDTGAMYRAVTLAAMQRNIELTDDAAIEALFGSVKFSFSVKGSQTIVHIDSSDVTEDIRRPDVTANVHYIASSPRLRKRLVQMQRDFAEAHQKIVTEGRDQGTIAFPNADVKFFLAADEKERARRRQAELAAKGKAPDIAETLKAIARRDKSDESRAVGPLKPAADAITIDTTHLSIEETVEKLLSNVQKKQ
jgi:cytidylate kinase